jgi:hypothetical protein
VRAAARNARAAADRAAARRRREQGTRAVPRGASGAPREATRDASSGEEATGDDGFYYEGGVCI